MDPSPSADESPATSRKRRRVDEARRWDAYDMAMQELARESSSGVSQTGESAVVLLDGTAGGWEGAPLPVLAFATQLHAPVPSGRGEPSTAAPASGGALLAGGRLPLRTAEAGPAPAESYAATLRRVSRLVDTKLLF